MNAATLAPELLRKMDAYWRAANYLSVGQIYLFDNPLLRRPLLLSDVKPMLLGHWGTTPGQNFIYVHLNRIIREYDLDMIYVCGPGHGGPAVVANTYLEGSYSEIYPHIGQDESGLQKLFLQFSFPGGIPSHASPECPGSIHEGGELGYSLSHSFGAVFDNPSLVVACVIGDGEAETGPLATAWHSNKFLDPASDGAVLPILHLNGYKIANPSVLARITHEELEQLFLGYGWTPLFVEGSDPALMHEAMARALDSAILQIKAIQHRARVDGERTRPRWPMIVLSSPKGWTGPKVVDGKSIEGTSRAHQVPISAPSAQPAHLKLLEDWLKSYRPEELFDERGRLNAELAELAPQGNRRMGANPHANGGALLRDLQLPDFRHYAASVPAPGTPGIGDTRVLGPFLRDVAKRNESPRNFRVFGPDETASNGLAALFEVTNRQWDATTLPDDEFLAPSGGVVDSMLSEHQCQGWLEGYLLTGRHGLFNCYEAFIHIVDSMFNQHAKWLKVSAQLPWRRPIASLNYLLASHVWRQDHNGFSHQDPGFIDHVTNKKAGVVRVYLPPDANCLLSVMDHCLRSRHYVNVVIAGKHPAPQWLDMDAAVAHCAAGIGIWSWAGSDAGQEPDVVMACCGDVPTLETLAAVSILREHLPALKIRVVNVVDLMRLQPSGEHPHGLSDADFDALFTRDKPVIFAFHAYPSLIHKLTYRRTNHRNIHVRGYKEEGTITTPFDMTVLNDIDRFHLVIDVIDRLPHTADEGAALKRRLEAKLIEHRRYITRHGQDLPEIPQLALGADAVSLRSASPVARPSAQRRAATGVLMSDDLPLPLRIYLIRHGQTEWSLAGRYTGLTDIGLTAFGERESASLASRLGDTVFAQVLASPLQRARHTCTLAGLDAVVDVDHDLVEWDYGDYEGRYSADVHREHPDWSVFRDGCPKGESVQQVCDRADRVIGRLRSRNGNIAIFSHGQFGRVLAMRWLGMPMIQARHFALDTASISILAHASGQPDVAVIALWNSPPGITADGAGDEVIGMADAGKQSALQRWENEGGEVLHGIPRRALETP